MTTGTQRSKDLWFSVFLRSNYVAIFLVLRCVDVWCRQYYIYCNVKYSVWLSPFVTVVVHAPGESCLQGNFDYMAVILLHIFDLLVRFPISALLLAHCQFTTKVRCCSMQFIFDTIISLIIHNYIHVPTFCKNQLLTYCLSDLYLLGT